MQKRTEIIILVIVFLSLIAVGTISFILLQKKTPSSQNKTAEQAQTQHATQTTVIENDAELTNAENELDNTDVFSIDAALNDNDYDASKF